jgi:uncharacterized protein with HEPN domain
MQDSSGGKAAVFASPTLQDAILRNLQIMCESAQRLSETSRNSHPEVNWRAISGFRNVLVHDYFATDLETIWTIVQRDLPLLQGAVNSLMGEPL